MQFMCGCCVRANHVQLLHFVLRSCHHKLLRLRWWAMCVFDDHTRGGIAEVLAWRQVLGIQLCEVAKHNGCLCTNAADALYRLRYMALDVAVDVFAHQLCGSACVAGGYAAARSHVGYHTYDHVAGVRHSADPICVRAFGDIDVFIFDSHANIAVPPGFRAAHSRWRAAMRELANARTISVITSTVQQVCGVGVHCAKRPQLTYREYAREMRNKRRQSRWIPAPKLWLSSEAAEQALNNYDTYQSFDKYYHAYLHGVTDLVLDRRLLGRPCTIQLVQTSATTPTQVIQGFDLTCCAAFMAPYFTASGALHLDWIGVTWVNLAAYEHTMKHKAAVQLTTSLFAANIVKFREHRYTTNGRTVNVQLKRTNESVYRMRKWIVRGYEMLTDVLTVDRFGPTMLHVVDCSRSPACVTGVDMG